MISRNFRSHCQWTCLLLVGFGFDAGAQQDAEREVISVRLVESALRVEGQKGDLVSGLKASDFRLTLGGKAVPVAALEEISIASSTDVSGVPSGRRESPRNLVLLFDRELTEGPLIDRAREEAASFVLRSLGPNDLVSVAQYSHATDLEVLLPFTTDRRQIVHALATLQHENRSEPEDPLGLVLTDVMQEPASAESTRPVVIPKTSRQARGSRVGQPSANDAARGVRFLRALEDLAQRLEATSTAKYVVLFSRGIDDRLLFGTPSGRASDFSFRGALETTADLSRSQGLSELRTATDLAVRSFVLSATTVHAVDLGTVGSSSPTGTGFLRYLAGETGGTISSQMSLNQALARVAATTEHNYILAFVPPPCGGSFPGRPQPS